MAKGMRGQWRKKRRENRRREGTDEAACRGPECAGA
jgi:hypothetical protein